MRKYLYQCIVADQFFQYVDDLRTAAFTFGQFLDNLTAIFESKENTGLQISPSKCELGLIESTFLGNTISSEGMSAIKTKDSEFLSTLKTPKTVKQIRRLIGFLQFFTSFVPNLGKKLPAFYCLLRSENKLKLTEEHFQSTNQLRKDFQQACIMSLRLPKANAKYVILTDASFNAAGYVLMIENYLTDQSGKIFKTYRGKFRCPLNRKFLLRLT